MHRVESEARNSLQVKIMDKKSFFEEIQGKVNQILENSPAKDIEKNVRAMLTQAFAKLDLVTREEFEAQTLMIAQLKARVDALERLSAQQQAGQATDEPSPSI
jgi:hypothetical protein